MNIRKAIDSLKLELKKIDDAIATIEAAVTSQHEKLLARDKKNKTEDAEGAAKDRWPR